MYRSVMSMRSEGLQKVTAEPDRQQVTALLDEFQKGRITIRCTSMF
ncbi:hypothetical protein JM93_00067 [Roseibium hamelinense]|uniref:Uncharacterized protein n=1 Tax=Roseibium hamelinense TaxID=150831 RepID=A0A562TG81_9HYPH|nr:hypothetical protein JM93_00067 [Roseibium hamelinense]